MTTISFDAAIIPARAASARCDRRLFSWRCSRHEHLQWISPATKMPPRRKKLATSAMRVGRKSSFRWTSPKAQVRRMWRTVQSAAEQIQSTFKLMTTVMPKSGLNPNRTTIDPIQKTANQRHGSPAGPTGLTLNPGRPKCRPRSTASVGSARAIYDVPFSFSVQIAETPCPAASMNSCPAPRNGTFA